MGQKTKKGKGRLDKYYYLAKEQGFRSRAAFKLIQLNKKYDFLGSARAVLDLCAAPGGWLQVASKYTPVSSLIIGVDLDPIKPIKNVTTFQADITTAKCRAELKRLTQGSKVDVVLHDGAPNVGTAWTHDAFSQAELVLCSLKLATEFLKQGGCFVTKIFRSADYNSLLWVFSQLFKNVNATKPQASRNASAEIFVVCQGYLDPKKIDPRLLDPKFAFKEVETTVELPGVFEKQPRRSRQGYEDGNLILFKKSSIADFVESDDPIKMLAVYNQFELDERSKIYTEQKETTKEILALCSDLKVLGKPDFKLLLKWRSSVQQYRTDTLSEDEENDSDEDSARPLTVEEEEELVDQDLQNQIENASQKQQKLKKKLDKRRKKLIEELRVKSLKVAEADTPIDLDLFKLSSIKNDAALHSAAAVDLEAVPAESMEEEVKAKIHKPRKEDIIIEEGENPEEVYLDHLEDQMDSLYESYLDKKAARRLQKRQEAQKKKKEFELDDDIPQFAEDSDAEEETSNSLLHRETGPTMKATVRASRWFSQDIFAGIEDEAAIHQMKDLSAKRKQQEESKSKQTKRGKDDSDSEEEQKSKRQKKEEQDFEEVPVQKYESDSDLDEAERVDGLALATMMVKNKKLKEDLIDNSFNRYTWSDDNLPQWFVDEETEHMQPQLPITKAVAKEIRDKIKALDARPIKKVAEAKARKKMQAARRLSKIQSQAESIAEAGDMNPGDKMKAISKLYKKATKGTKKKTVLIVNRKSGGRVAQGMTKTKGTKLKLVDARMRKDMRAQTSKGKNKKR